jgi:hypothetical protein
MSDETKAMPSTRRPRGLAVWGGTVLILSGWLFALSSTGLLGPAFRWWALFILATALGLLTLAGLAWARSGSPFHWGARLSLSSGAVVLTVALIFLANLGWAVWWPLMLVVPGLVLVYNGLPDPRARCRPVANLILWTGAAVALLGGAFLLQTWGWVDLAALGGSFQWWGLAIAIPALGALYNAAVAYRSYGGMNLLTQGLLFVGLTVGAVAAVALLGLDWNLLNGTVPIIAGLVAFTAFLRPAPRRSASR